MYGMEVVVVFVEVEEDVIVVLGIVVGRLIVVRVSIVSVVCLNSFICYFFFLWFFRFFCIWDRLGIFGDFDWGFIFCYIV